MKQKFILTGFGLCSKRYKLSHHQNQVVYGVVPMYIFMCCLASKMPQVVLPNGGRGSIFFED